jgi:HD-GYP domain-containing protein (c-di-GMP phosphodiesterase class II)
MHAARVTIFSIIQAKALGLEGDVMHDIGIAGLLHDVGKTFVSTEILDKKEALNDGEWAEVKKHPVYGAMYLSAFHNVPKLAVVTAFEHHMKYDGSGYPDTKRRGRRQHILSQIIAISDFFDALRTERPYRKALEVPEILGIMRESSGKDFNPLLVDNFASSVLRAKVSG